MTNLESKGYQETFSPFAEPDANNPDPVVRKRFFGKYRGSVIANVDPMAQGRLLVSVPDVLGLFESTWALPCVPFTGPAMGAYFIPAVASPVWVEFEQGDPDNPIWVGGYWDVPHETSPTAQASMATAPELAVIDIATPSSGITICDVPLAPYAGQVSIRTSAGAVLIMLTSEGINIVAPALTVTATNITLNGTVVINGATTINGVTDINGDTEINGEADINGDANITGAATIEGDANVAGAATIEGDVSIAGAADIGGAEVVAGDLTVLGLFIP